MLCNKQISCIHNKKSSFYYKDDYVSSKHTFKLKSDFFNNQFHAQFKESVPLVLKISSPNKNLTISNELQESSTNSPEKSTASEKKKKSQTVKVKPDQTSSDLLTVPGIGIKNLEKLNSKGILRLSELKTLSEKFHSEQDKMVNFLRTFVGLRKDHAASIASYLTDHPQKDKNAADTKPSSARPSASRLTFCVEGNISVGKTTFLQRIANETVELRDLVEVVPEPISKWQDVGKDHFNILRSFYEEPARYAYTFQNYVFVTRMLQERESCGGARPLRLMERSVFSDRMVFVRAVHEAKWMNDLELSVYDSWFDPVVSSLPGLVPDAFIYLRAEPETCFQRLHKRSRGEESNVSMDYLQGLHEKHEQWLLPAANSSSGKVCVEEMDLQGRIPPPLKIADRVFALRGDHVHSSIQQIPALVLDCDANIDFSRDLKAKSLYASQVAEFFDYVSKVKAARNEKNENSKKILLPKSNQIIIPNSLIL